MAIECSEDGSIFLTSQVSDTITFDVTHDNEAFNVGTLVAFDSFGIEQWYRRFTAVDVLPYDVKIT